MSDETPPDNLRRFERALEKLQPSVEEVRARHGHLVRQWWEEYPGAPRLRFVEGLVELWEGLCLHLVEGMADLAVPGTLAAGTARGLETRAEPVPPRARGWCKDGQDCYGILMMKPGGARKLTLELSLRDEQDRLIQPFLLTLIGGNGEKLLDRKEVRARNYVLRELELADYLFVLESPDGERSVRMGWKAGR